MVTNNRVFTEVPFRESDLFFRDTIIAEDDLIDKLTYKLEFTLYIERKKNWKDFVTRDKNVREWMRTIVGYGLQNSTIKEEIDTKEQYNNLKKITNYKAVDEQIKARKNYQDAIAVLTKEPKDWNT